MSTFSKSTRFLRIANRLNGKRVFSTAPDRSASSRINQIYQPAGRPFPEAKSVLPEGHTLDNDAVLAKHVDREWSAEELDDIRKNNTMIAWGAGNATLNGLQHITHGDGVYLHRKDGHKILDFCSQAMCANMGHTIHPNVLGAITKQLEEIPMLFGTDFLCDVRLKLSSLLKDIFPGDLNGFFFTSGGAEANEAAVRMARIKTGRYKILSRYRSYHGSMGTTISLTGDQRNWFGGPVAPGVVKFSDPWPFSYSLGQSEEEICKFSLDALREQIENEGPNHVAAIIMESVTGTNGILIPPKGYMEGVRALCDEYGIVMICDEVMAGFGRTGKWFGFMHTTPMIVPDIVTAAKGINGAILPLGLVAVRTEIKEFFDKHPIGTGTTYNAHPTALASSYAYLQEMIRQDVVGNVKKMEKVQQECMAELVEKHPTVRQCRSIGLFGIIDFQKNAKGDLFAHYNEGMAPVMPKLRKFLIDNGLWTFMRPTGGIHVNPPLVSTEENIREGYSIISKGLSEVVDPLFEK